jgi:hypothetical protein
LSEVVAEKPPSPIASPAPRKRLPRREWTIATVGSVLLAIAMVWIIPPYASYLANGGTKPAVIADPVHTIIGDAGDSTAQAWLLGWDGHALRHGLRGLWETNAFYPDRYALALSDSLFGYAPAGLIGHGVTAAILRYNIVFVLAFALSFLGGYALLRTLGAEPVAAAVAGAAVTYAPWRYGHVGHLNVLSTGGITLAFAMLARGHGWSLRRGFRRDEVRPGWAVAGWLVAAWQVSLGFAVGLGFVYLVAVACVCGLVGWLVRGRPSPGRRLVVSDLAGSVVFSAVTLYFAYPYEQIRDLYPDVVRSWEYVAVFSPTARGLLVSPAYSLPWGRLHEAARTELGSAANEKALLCGFVLYLLAFAGLFVSVWTLRQRLLMLTGVWLGVLFALGTNGPAYRLLYLYVPGFDGSRTPGRLILWPTVLLAVLAAGFVAELARIARKVTLPRWSAVAARVVTVPLLFLVLAEGMPDMDHVAVKAEPAAMKAAPTPMMVLPSDDGIDSNVMLWSTDGYPAMVNGTASYSPPGHQTLRDTMRAFPRPWTLDLLRRWGIRSVVVVRDRVAGTPYAAVLDAEAVPGVTRQDIGPDVLFTLG